MSETDTAARAAVDERTVAAVLAGDREAFREIVARHQAMVAGVAWRYGVRREDVEDTVSEVFIRAYEHLHQYRPDHAFATWLYRLAVNHVIDRGRRARKERGRSEMPIQVADGRPGAAEAIEVDERADLLRRALEELDPRYREVLFVVYVEGLKIEETARVLNLPEGTVKTRLMRGRHALRKILVRRHPEHFGSVR